MAPSITDAMLFDMVICPHRATMDVHGKPAERAPANALTAALWRRSTARADAVVRAMKLDMVDLSAFDGEARERATGEAMAARRPLIFGGAIRDGHLSGTPDLLRLDEDGYVAGNVRSTSTDDGAESARKPRRSFGMALALCTDILERRDLSAGRYGFIVDGHGEETTYELDAPRGPRTGLTLWQEYQKALALAREVVTRRDATRPAWSSACRLCDWQSSCVRRLEREDDLSLLPEVGRSTRDAIAVRFPTISALAAADPEELADEARNLEGVGAAMLRRLHDRARLLTRRGGQPFRRAEIELPEASSEVFFDMEMDPLRDHCFLHGFLERADGKKPRYRAFFAEDASEESEEAAFGQAWQYLSSLGDSVVYHYGAGERMALRALQERYPQVCDSDELDEMLAAQTTVDLYASVVRPRTEWPTRDYSAPSIADHLGFRRREDVSSGIASIELYERWLESRDKALKTRILSCNEDDCRALACVLDAVRELAPDDDAW